LNKAVELVKLWGAFEEQNPDGSIDDFCRQQLAQSLKEEKKSCPRLAIGP